MEIFADQNRAHLQIAHQDFFDEVLRREARQLQREGHHDSGLETSYTEPLHALRVGGKALRSGFRLKDSARRGIEGKRSRDRATFHGALCDCAQDRLVLGQ